MNTIEEDIYLLTNSINDAYGIHSQERRALDRLATEIRDKGKEIHAGCDRFAVAG